MNPREFCRERDFNSAILLTYSFDPLFFERVVLKDLWAGGTGDILVLADARQINESAKRWAGQLRTLGRRYQLIPSATSGPFHPKIMLRVGSEGAAVWVGSGNLTSGGWGSNHEVCCAWMLGPSQDDKGAWMAHFLERVASWCSSRLQHNIIQRILETPWVQEVRNDTSEGPELITTGYGPTSLSSQLQKRWAGRRFEEVRIFTGSTDKSGAFIQWLHDKFGIKRSLIILDETRASFIPEKLERLPVQTTVLHLPGRRPAHAKFYWFEGPEGAAAIMGSANCSAAAWLLAPESGGNIEAVTIYDEANPADFESILKVLQSEDLTPAKLILRASNDERIETSSALSISEIGWEGSTGELHVNLTQALPSEAKVSLEFHGQIFSMARQDLMGRIWVTEVPDLANEQETVFVTVIVHNADGTEIQLRGWINDLTELRHSARGRHIADALTALGENLSSYEQQKAVAQLQKLSLILLTEPTSFPDPFVGSSNKTKEKEEEELKKALEPTDPEKFVRSINDLEYSNYQVQEGHSGPSLSLVGVMRAIFGSQQSTEFDDEVDFAEEPENADDEQQQDLQYSLGTDTTAKRRITLPDDRNKRRLGDQIQNFLSNLAKLEFANQCTATQLVQAAAYPLAVASIGSTGGWVDNDQAQSWAVQIFDILLSQRKSSKGLLETVRTRYRDSSREDDFLRIVGDGTLWVSLLSALANVPWKGRNAGLEKALALRSVLAVSDLIASTNGGRMQQLLSRLEEQKARAIIQLAPRAINSLKKIEAVMLQHLKDLFSLQEKVKTRYEMGDLLWKPEAGWAEMRENAAWDDNAEAYLHMRAAVKKIRPQLYVNVTKATAHNEVLSQALKELDSY